MVSIFTHKISRAAVAAGCSLLAAAQGVQAQDYPVRPVRLVAPFSAGGGADSVARLMAESLSESFGRQVIVDNRPGASNIIGTDVVAKAQPDGYTILLAINNHVINASLFPKLPYDTERDFTPITLIGLNPFILVVHPSLPVRSVQDLVKLARAKPGVLNYASAGNGTVAHVAAELFNVRAKVKMTHIPYKGVSQAVIDAPEKIADPSIRPLMRKIRVHGSDALRRIMSESKGPEAKPAKIRVRTTTGREFAEEIMGHSGHPDRPQSERRAAINAKLDRCAKAVQMRDEQRERIRDAWWNVAQAADIGAPIRTMTGFRTPV